MINKLPNSQRAELLQREMKAVATWLRSGEVGRFDCKGIGDGDPVARKAENHPLEGCRCLALEPTSGAPRIIRSDAGNVVMHRILVNIVQASEVGLFEGKVGLPILEPHFATRRTVEAIHFRCRDGVEVAHKRGE